MKTILILAVVTMVATANLRQNILEEIRSLKAKHNDAHEPIVGDFLKKMADTMVQGGMCVEYTGAGLEVLDDAKQHWGKWGEDVFDLVFAALFEKQSWQQYCAPLFHRESEKAILPGVPTPDQILPGVPTPEQEILPGVPTPAEGEVRVVPLRVIMAFEQFKKDFGRVYEGEEHEYRLGVFHDNLMWMEEFNSQVPKPSFTVGVGPMADLTNDEFKEMYVSGGYRARPDSERNVVILPEVDYETTGSVDWRTKGIVNPVKNQEACGSCWAFSAVAAMEGAYAQKNGELKSFSE